MTVTVAASRFADALPKVFSTRVADDPVSRRCATKRVAKAFVLLPGRVEVRNGDEHRRQDRQHRIDGRRTPPSCGWQRGTCGTTPARAGRAEYRSGRSANPATP